MAIGYGVPVPKPQPRVRLKKRYQAERAQDLKRSRDEVWQRDEHRCRVCGSKVTRGTDSLTRGEVHHIVPRSRLAKGQHAETSNLVLLCVACHRDAQAYRVFFHGNANTAGFRIERAK